MFAMPYHFVSLAQLMEDVRNNVSRVPREIDLVVGIPRSGMIPAYAVGLYLNTHVMDLPGFVARRTPTHGRTRRPANALEDSFSAKCVLLVDDSCASGETLAHAVAAIRGAGYPGRIVTCTAIVEPCAAHKVDVWFTKVPTPRVFEWNVFHHGIIETSCIDFDGVLCVDPTEDENDDGARYRAFLANAAPRFVPTRPVGHIVSARLEKYRAESEEWLARQGIRYTELHLLDLPSKEARLRTQAHHGHKANVYRSVDAPLFIESDQSQAMHIAQATGKPALCTDTMTLFHGNGVYFQNVVRYVKQERRGVMRSMASWGRRLLSLRTVHARRRRSEAE